MHWRMTEQRIINAVPINNFLISFLTHCGYNNNTIFEYDDFFISEGQTDFKRTKKVVYFLN